MGPLIPVLWTSGDICPRFQSQGRCLTAGIQSEDLPHSKQTRYPLGHCDRLFLIVSFNNSIISYLYVFVQKYTFWNEGITVIMKLLCDRDKRSFEKECQSETGCVQTVYYGNNLNKRCFLILVMK